MVTFPLVILRMLKPTVGIMSSLNWPDCRTTDRQTESFNTVYIWCDWDLLHHRPNIPAAPQQVLMWLTAAKHLNLCTDEPPEQVCVLNTQTLLKQTTWLDRMPDADWLRNWVLDWQMLDRTSPPVRLNLRHCVWSDDTVFDTLRLIKNVSAKGTNVIKLKLMILGVW